MCTLTNANAALVIEALRAYANALCEQVHYEKAAYSVADIIAGNDKASAMEALAARLEGESKAIAENAPPIQNR